jgi:Flp pilus assembly pilin Flp
MKEATMYRSRATALAVRFLHDISGATAIEYGLIAAGIGGAVASTVWAVGGAVRTNFYDKLASLFN